MKWSQQWKPALLTVFDAVCWLLIAGLIFNAMWELYRPRTNRAILSLVAAILLIAMLNYRELRQIWGIVKHLEKKVDDEKSA